MKLMTWNESYAIGHDKIDAEHRQIFAMLGECYSSLMTGVELARVVRAYQKAFDFASRHMVEEEQEFSGIGYGGAERHVEEHRRLTARSKEMIRTLSTGRGAVSFAELQFLLSWMMAHILREDRRFASFIGKGRETSPAADCTEDGAMI